MPNDFQYDFFFSHSAKGKAVVRLPAERSKACGAQGAKQRQKDVLKVRRPT